MEPDKPVVITYEPISKNTVSRALGWLAELLGFESSKTTDNRRSAVGQAHPLYLMHTQAQQHLSQPGLLWAVSREVMQLALYAIELHAVRHWPGFDKLVARVVREQKTWDAHLLEASVATRYHAAGWDGEFLYDSEKSIPDLRVFIEGKEVLIECRHSRKLAKHEQRYFAVWSRAAHEVMRFLAQHAPGAMVRFYPARDAKLGDSDYLVQGVARQLENWHRQRETLGIATHVRFADSKGDFKGLLIVSSDPDYLFDNLPSIKVPDGKSLPALEVPGGTEPLAVSLDLEMSEVPKCTGLWYAKVHTKRISQDQEKSVLDRLDKKAGQLNRHRQAYGQPLPGIVWIEHPPLMEADQEELKHLTDRIKGKFRTDKAGHFASVAAVVLTQSRWVLTKKAELLRQDRYSFVPNLQASPALPSEFPYSTSEWWNKMGERGFLKLDVSFPNGP